MIGHRGARRNVSAVQLTGVLASALLLSTVANGAVAQTATPTPTGSATPTATQTEGPTPKPSPTTTAGGPAILKVEPTPAPLPLPSITSEQAAQLRQIIVQGRIAQGLRFSARAAEALPQDDAGLVRAALDYARAIHIGRLQQSDFISDWALRPAEWDPLPEFTRALAENRLSKWFNSLPPPYEGYETLRLGLARYRLIAAAGGWSAIPAGPDMALGASGARVSALRKRLAVEDNSVSTEGDKFDEALKEAVIRAQRRYGLNPTGTVSTGTLSALNVPVEQRIRQIMANMERWRWMPRSMQTDRVQVNIASASVAVFEGDRPVMSMRGVTGAPQTATPMLMSSIHSIVVNPPWNVPAGIAARELFPKGPAYLARNGFKVIGTGPNRRLQQSPEFSALGRFKFDFDNPFAVYLHDTPSKGTFSRYDRLASHGCIRLERPSDLANHLLRNNADYTPDRIQELIDGGKTTRVRLDKQVAVYLLYWTAYGNSTGIMSFRGDPYSWDKLLAAKIEARSSAQEASAD